MVNFDQGFSIQPSPRALGRNKISTNKKPLRHTIRQLLKRWHKADLPQVTMLTGLRLYMSLAAQAEQALPEPVAIARQLLTQALTVLQARDEPAANLLRQRFLKNMSVKEMARRLNVSENHYFRLQNEAINQLTEIVLEREQLAQVKYRLAVEARLEAPTYRQLFGVNQARQSLRFALERREGPWIIAIDGMGGIGKTSLADALVRDMTLTNRFYDIAWVSARQQYFLPGSGLQQTSRPALDAETLTDTLLAQCAGGLPASLSFQQKFAILTGLLKKFPYLVVIDNLETIADYQTLLPTLYRLAGPTKFLLTSRHSLRAAPDIFCVSLEELSQADIFVLLKHEAEARGLSALANASPTQLKSIYEVVGGNPLAVKLVIGQTCALPLSQVLENLKQARGKRTDELYTYIYWQAWQALTPGSQQALLVMPFAPPQGSTFDHLSAVSGLEVAELSQALEQLTALSLVEVSGDIEYRRYRIHRLTETFLMTEVTRWQSSP